MDNYGEIQIGIALPEDVDMLVDIRFREQAELYPGRSPYEGFECDVHSFFTDCIGSDRYLILVARYNGSIAATAMFTMEKEPPQFIDNGVYAYMCNVYTMPEHRGRGLLTRMYSHALPLLRQRNVCAVFADTKMPVMQAFYVKHGWDRRDDYFSLYF